MDSAKVTMVVVNQEEEIIYEGKSHKLQASVTNADDYSAIIDDTVHLYLHCTTTTWWGSNNFQLVIFRREMSAWWGFH